MPDRASPSVDEAVQRQRQRLHDLRNAVNAAGLCVHAAELMLRAGHTDKTQENLARAAKALERARQLLSPSFDES